MGVRGPEGGGGGVVRTASPNGVDQMMADNTARSGLVPGGRGSAVVRVPCERREMPRSLALQSYQ